MRKIVIFDDDIGILSICTYILEEEGWQVHAFPNCNDLVERVSTINPSIILMDNWIPEQGGIEATRMIKATEHLRYIPVIYFSANNDIAELAADAGADSYLAKPFDLGDLQIKIGNVIRA